MAYNLTKYKHLFSIFKKKVDPLQVSDYKTPEQLFTSLYAFETGLSELELKKMPKTLENFSKKMKRLLHQKQGRVLDVDLSLSHTYESYTKNVDELIFGTQEIQHETTIDQIVELTKQMSRYDLTGYVKCLIPQVESHFSLYERLLERFVKLQERIGRQIFKGFFRFSQKVSKIAFLEERQYKGDFKFELIDDIEKLEKGIEAMYHCAQFNKLRDKLSLACQLAISSKLSQLDPLNLSRVLFCLASSGRPLKLIQQNYHQIRQKTEQYPFEMLYYMLMSGIEDTIWMQSLSNKLVLQPKNIHEQLVSKMIQGIVKEKYKCNIEVIEKEQFKLTSEKHEGQQFFENFLERYGYTFTSVRHWLFPYTIYEIQGKKFICFDHWTVKDENLAISGVGTIIKQYFHEKNEVIKHINWPRMLSMDKRGLRDEYIFSKFKGIDRPKKVKVRYYE